MAPRKSERLVNLTICLLAARRYVSRDDLRGTIEGYHDLSDVAFLRTFERDKDELRGMGIPLETGSNSVLHEDEVGYRISRQEFELPPLDLTPDEATAVALAAQMWQEATMAEHTRSALAKLRSAGAEPDARRLAALAPAPGSGLSSGPAVDVLVAAVRDRRRVEFQYKGGRRRTLEPWLVTFRRGAWYVLGRDVDAGEERMFRTTRMTGDVVAVGEPGAFTPPDGRGAKSAAARLTPAEPNRMARLALAPGIGSGLRRAGVAAADTAGAPEGFDVVDVPFTTASRLAGDVAALGEDAHVLGPDDLRDAVVALLIGAAA